MSTTRQEAVRYWWEQAEESLASAQREFKAGAYSFEKNYVETLLGHCEQFLVNVRPLVASLN
jgi:HEPN domain-containing protein